MKDSKESTYVGPDEIAREWDVSKATAYNIIRRLNEQLKKEVPIAIIVPGKVNRNYYEKARLAHYNT